MSEWPSSLGVKLCSAGLLGKESLALYKAQASERSPLPLQVTVGSIWFNPPSVAFPDSNHPPPTPSQKRDAKPKVKERCKLQKLNCRHKLAQANSDERVERVPALPDGSQWMVT